MSKAKSRWSKSTHDVGGLSRQPIHSFAAEEIVSPEFLGPIRRLGADVRVIDWIPRTEFTERIPGGKHSFWGYSLNRLV